MNEGNTESDLPRGHTSCWLAMCDALARVLHHQQPRKNVVHKNYEQPHEGSSQSDVHTLVSL
jgi:hypothetical protein